MVKMSVPKKRTFFQWDNIKQMAGITLLEKHPLSENNK